MVQTFAEDDLGRVEAREFGQNISHALASCY